ncbi:MAG: hypothetical protein WB421_01635 [Terriglobales bacterium]
MPMTKVKQAVVALLSMTVVLGNSTSASVAPPESFDKPVRKTVVNLGRSTTPSINARIQLSCFYYPDFMVKELNDRGVKGVRWVTATPVINEDAPACRLARSSTERFMAKEWWSFEGVKGSLLFLEAADGDDNGGMPFRILDLKTGKKIFEDSAWWDSHLEFAHTADETVSLRYLRVVGGDCSIPKDGMSCWSKFRTRYGLAITTVPKCTGYRHEGEKEWVAGDEGVPPERIDTPSTITYPVEVELFPRPSIRAVPGPVKCGPVP